MRRAAAIWFVMNIVLWCTPNLLHAQENATADQPKLEKTEHESKVQDDRRAKPLQPFRLDFLFNELEDGKKVNTRHYSMNLTAGSSDELKIGTRVPVATTESPTFPTQYQYLDLGTSIWAILRDSTDELQLEVRSEISWTKHESGDAETRPAHGAFMPPIVSQIKINGSTLLIVGKPIIIGSVDDPYSNRQFQLEVTATKLK